MKSNGNPSKYPIPETKELVFQYDHGTDTLILGGGTPASYGFPVADGPMMFCNDGGAPHLVSLEDARSVLLALLQEPE